MNKMVRVRSVNSNPNPIGIHLTVSHVVNEGHKQFGFALADDGSEFFIPRGVIVKEQMTSADIGAGFTARIIECRNPDPMRDKADLNHVALPVTWDGAAELVEVDDEEPEREAELQADLDELVVKVDDYLGHVDTICKRLETTMAEMMEDRNRLLNEAAAIREWIND